MSNNITYPELYYSSQISSILSSKPTLQKAPEVPIEPKKPIEPEKNDGSSRGCSIMMIIVGVVLFCYALSSNEVKTGLLLPSIGIIILSFFTYKMCSWDKDDAEKKMDDYKQAIKDYPNKLKEYENEKKRYEIRKYFYDRAVNRIMSATYLQDYRKKKIQSYLSKKVVPNFEKCDDSDIVKKGASEDFFVSYLKDSTEWDVYVDMRVPVGTKYYYPDIIVVISNVYINVEIDEPYTGNDGEPIHYIENSYGSLFKSVDSKRNEYMTKNGWVVVRFSEEQIFLHTDECLAYLYLVVQNIEDGVEDVFCDADFKKEKWTKDQAYKMAYKRFRRTYVPELYQSNIDKEDYRNYEEIKEEIFSDKTNLKNIN